MVRRPERPRSQQPRRIFKNAGHTVNPRRLDGLVKRHGRQNRRNPFGQHRLPRARRPEKKNVVAARARNFQRAFRGLLPVNVPQIHAVLRGIPQHLLGVHTDTLERLG